MSLKFRTDELTPAEASFLTWQFGYQDEDDPFFVSLWHTINRAWISDQRSTLDHQRTQHLSRLAAGGAYPEEVAIFLKFKSEQGEDYWLNMLQRAGLDDRRQQSVPPTVERRRRTSTRRSAPTS
ncbi:MAG: hypothetical protein V4568_00895 [Pseudomonadota bacterium]